MKRLHMNNRLYLFVLMLLLSVNVFIVSAQDGEPMANEECTTETMADAPAQIDELYTTAQTAFDNGDIRGWLDNLRAISWLTNSLRAYCDGYLFEGDADGSNSEVFGPITFVPGIYTVTATTDGFMSAQLETISGECGRFSLALFEGDATNGSQEIFRVEGENCVALLEVSNLTAPWTLEFSFIATGD